MTVSVFAFSQLGNFTALKDLLQDDNLKHIEYWSHEVARCHEGIDVLFFVHACSRQWRRRAVLRDTLVEEAAARRFNWAAVFFVGRRAKDPLLDAWLNLEADALGDLVVFPFEDGYRTVTPQVDERHAMGGRPLSQRAGDRQAGRRMSPFTRSR
ncbi:hypothetical protein HPB48_021749 [Haemaphysalis longicornis]|uniref:Uncharacterized protein n=1 Tax=Haemaphysalis longicornis TaxID=44386 RepID=A0A9J6FW17_HAELO|nr:hypothetical protein HPB48_021749 [Haemaphysalis longicornis]